MSYMENRYSISQIVLLLSVSLSFFFPSLAQTRAKFSPIVDTTRFELIINYDREQISLSRKEINKNISVPWSWLMVSRADRKHEDVEDYVPSFNYDKEITVFSISNNLLGLHLSSYKIPKGGSAQAAAGRDLFLVYKLDTEKLYRGRVNLGLTKWRFRSSGCFSAVYTRFLLSDINNDTYMDIGIIKEELQCNKLESGIEKKERYYKHPIRWAIFHKDRWEYLPQFDGRFPGQDFVELPMIGLLKSPVDYVEEINKKLR